MNAKSYTTNSMESRSRNVYAKTLRPYRSAKFEGIIKMTNSWKTCLTFAMNCRLPKTTVARIVKASLRKKEVHVKAEERAFKEEDWKTAEELTVRLQFLQKSCEVAEEMGRDTI